MWGGASTEHFVVMVLNSFVRQITPICVRSIFGSVGICWQHKRGRARDITMNSSLNEKGSAGGESRILREQLRWERGWEECVNPSIKWNPFSSLTVHYFLHWSLAELHMCEMEFFGKLFFLFLAMLLTFWTRNWCPDTWALAASALPESWSSEALGAALRVPSYLEHPKGSVVSS